MVSWFVSVTNEKISQLVKAAVSDNVKKAMKFGLAVFTGTLYMHVLYLLADIFTDNVKLN